MKKIWKYDSMEHLKADIPEECLDFPYDIHELVDNEYWTEWTGLLNSRINLLDTKKDIESIILQEFNQQGGSENIFYGGDDVMRFRKKIYIDNQHNLKSKWVADVETDFLFSSYPLTEGYLMGYSIETEFWDDGVFAGRKNEMLSKKERKFYLNYRDEITTMETSKFFTNKETFKTRRGFNILNFFRAPYGMHRFSREVKHLEILGNTRLKPVRYVIDYNNDRY